jgi:hypothetical protein
MPYFTCGIGRPFGPAYAAGRIKKAGLTRPFAVILALAASTSVVSGGE